MNAFRAARNGVIAAISCVGILPALVMSPASATALINCPGVRYIHTSSVNFPDPANTGSTCLTAHDGGTVASDGTFNAVIPFGALGWTATTSVFGQLLRITNNFGITWNLGPLPGSLAAIGDSPPDVTNLARDPLGRILSFSAGGSTVQYTYDGLSNRVLTTTAPGGNVTTYAYDAGRPNTVTESAGGGHMITYTYDSGSTRPGSAVESPGGHTLTYTYDANRLATKVDSSGPTTTYTYDGGSARVTKIEDTNGNRVTYTYDSGNIIESKQEHVPPDPDPAPLITQYEYDSQGHVTQVIDPQGVITRFEYDSVFRLTANIDAFGQPNQLITRFEYDQLGRLSHIVDPRGLRTNLTYVPAPGILLLLGLGLGALGLARRKIPDGKRPRKIVMRSLLPRASRP